MTGLDDQREPCMTFPASRWGPFGWGICPVCGDPWVDHEPAEREAGQ